MILGLSGSAYDVWSQGVSLHSRGIEFGFMRAAISTWFANTSYVDSRGIDRKLDYNAKFIKDSGAILGLYGVQDPGQDQPDQAWRFFDAAAPYNPDALIVDIELYRDHAKNTIPGDELSKRAKLYVDTLRSLTTKKIILYMGWWWIRWQCQQILSWMDDYPIWWVDAKGYRKMGLFTNTTLEYIKDHLPTNFTLGVPVPASYNSEQWFWQCCADSNKIPENQSAVEISQFNGSLADLQNLLAIQPPSPQPKTELERIIALEDQARTHGWTI